MDIIEKIEIKHFRSFDGGKDQKKVKIVGLSDLNIFSGSNDSGKSNILRALNLFFNDEISPGVKFDKNRDFSKIVANRFDDDIEQRKSEVIKRVNSYEDEKTRDLRRSDEIISIKLFFNNKEKQRGLPKKFWVSKSFSQKNNFEGEFNYQTDLRGNAQVKIFLSGFHFEYIPAIKDKIYFSHLFEKLQSFLFEKEGKGKHNKFAESSNNFNQMLRNETEVLFEEFQRSSGVIASFHIPSTLVDFFRTLSVRTENNISLFDRGDGVQARFIPEILNEISRDSKKNIIWAFEEPENSYEAKNIRKLRDEFVNKYSRTMQIFLTSHTKEFLAIERRYTKQEQAIEKNKKLSTKIKKDAAIARLSIDNSSSGISIYRVWKNESTNNSSLVTRFDDKNGVWEEICDDLGIIQESRVVEELQHKLVSQEKIIVESNLSIDKQKSISDDLYKNLKEIMTKLDDVNQQIEEFKKPILAVEDKYDAIYKISYLKIKNIPITLKNYNDIFSEKSPFMIVRAEGAGSLAGKLRMNNTDGYDEKKIIGLFDFDREGTENFYNLKNANNWDANISGNKSTGFYKQRNNHECFYGMLLPIPERHIDLVGDVSSGKFDAKVEIENLLSDSVLKRRKLVDEEKILTIKYLKIKKDVKSKLPRILVELDKSDFSDFVPLFDKIESLFGI